jgi:ribosomal protein S18 acetylase RimI-like enzyme
MIVREATVEDSAAIGRVQLASWRTMFKDTGIDADAYLAGFSPDEQTQDWQDLLSTLVDRVVYIAVNDAGEVVGFAYSVWERGSDTGELSAVHILPAYRNQGIGRQLIRASARRLQQKACTSLWLRTLTGNPARRLYERLGGMLIGEGQPESIDKDGAVIEVGEVTYRWADIQKLIDSCG